jgi:hypothetical protein
VARNEFEHKPRKPEETILYRTVASEMETFLARRQERERQTSRSSRARSYAEMATFA